MKSNLLKLLVLSILFACGSTKALYQPVEADVQRMSEKGMTTNLASLQHGYELFAKNCVECHSLTPPPRKSVEQWNRILKQMFPKTKMTQQEQELVKSYITARR